MSEAFDLWMKAEMAEPDEELELYLEAARRANWDALHGPPHLRSGRIRPVPPTEEREDG